MLSKFLKQDIFRLGWPSSSTLLKKKIEMYSNNFKQLFMIFQLPIFDNINCKIMMLISYRNGIFSWYG